MKILKISAIVLLSLLLIIAVLGLIAPKDFKIIRSITIPIKEKDILFDNILSTKKFLEWSPWAAKDPHQKISLYGTQGQKGSGYAWRGNDEVGSGSITLLSFIPNEKVMMELTFLDPFETKSTLIFTILPLEVGYRVSWEMTGQSPYPFNGIHLFMNMDQMVGPDFEEGLLNLKNKVLAESKLAR